jgi:D-sedoheptulose 7-phosphate isomerase
MDQTGYIADYLGGIETICKRIDRSAISRSIDLLWECWRNGKQVFLIGNGGSASTASHFACDLAKCTIVEGKPRLRVQSLVDNVPLITALTNDWGWNSVFVEQLKSFFQPDDLLIAISVHGGAGKDRADAWSQNLVQALQFAKSRRGKTIGLSGFDGGLFNEVCDVNLVVPYETTPHVESFHVTMHHLITFCLAERIRLGYS